MLAIYKREMRAYFTSPIGYIYIAAYLAVSGFLFSMFTVQAVIGGSDTDLAMYFTIMIFVFAVIIPLLTMKSLSEERKMKTEQLLLTAPVSLPAMITAKFLAAYTMFAGTYLISCLDYYVLFRYAPDALTVPNLRATLIGYSIAILLLGGAFVAVGLFVSSLTENQITAVIGTMAILMASLLCAFLNQYIDVYAVRAVLSWLSIFSRFTNFTFGMFDYAALLYYISIMFIFLFLTVRVYEKRRWS
ncbi:MAG: ABC transporter permease [Eubacteriales bacterium]|jgi:ABC-2 type transport system permease protein|nr:ABC transporter permease [Eubacteriales bacterium]